MRTITVFLLLLLLLCSGMALAENPFEKVGLANSIESKLDSLNRYEKNTSVMDVINALSQSKGYLRPTSVDTFIRLEQTIHDSLVAPTFVYIPKQYDSSNPTKMFIYLHGGVSRPDFPEVEVEGLREDPIFQLCAEKGWFYVFPLAKMGCTWWEYDGMVRLKHLITELKSVFNIDDDGVSIGGFSDGGSGSFHLAMLYPTPFAQFFPWSGHLTVGSLAGPMDQYVRSLQARPLYPTTGGRDGLYPTARMLPLIQFAEQSGATIEHVGYDTATHNDAYLTLELPRIAKLLEQGRRNVFSKQLVWETSDVRLGRVDWLEISELDTLSKPAEWYQDEQITLTDERVSIGFMPVQDTTSNGITVASVIDDSTSAANTAGLKAGDKIIQLDQFPITDARSLSVERSKKQRGDSIFLTVIRNQETLLLRGKIPPVMEYPAFQRRYKSGAVQATIEGNQITLLTSRVKSVRIFLHPKLISFEKPLIIKANGKRVFEHTVKPDVSFLVNQFRKYHDRAAMWQGYVDIKITN